MIPTTRKALTGSTSSAALPGARSTRGIATPLTESGVAALTTCDIRSIHFGSTLAVRDTYLPLRAHQITALIGPSGSGKSTILRCFNRMNDLIPGFHLDGSVEYAGVNIYDEGVDPVAVRRTVGMVFQRALPFAMSIFDNVAFGLEVTGHADDLRERVERALRTASLWGEVKDRLQASGLSLSEGQQQRLCIARALAVEPELLLMDEPCSGLDPVTSAHIEELMVELKRECTIAIVTHSLQRAERVADYTAFLQVDARRGCRTGYLVEYGPTRAVFGDPSEELTRQYIGARHG